MADQYCQGAVRLGARIWYSPDHPGWNEGQYGKQN